MSCLQVKNIAAATPEELQEDLNTLLRELGSRVKEIQFMHALTTDFACSVIYWSQDVSAEMTAKIESLPEDPEAKPGDPIFVCVLHDYERKIVKSALLHREELYRTTASTYYPSLRDDYLKKADKIKQLASRFENAIEQPETVEITGSNIP